MAVLHRNATFVLACALACGIALAQDRTQLPIQLKASSLDFDSQKGMVRYGSITITQGDIRISADHAVTTGRDFEDSRWEFAGSVRITTPESSLASDTARVHFASGEIQDATVTGSPATFEQRREQQRSQGRANRIDYDLKRGTVEFAGSAWLSDGRNEVSSETLVYSTKTQRVISKEPVVITIQPNEQPSVEPKPPS
jgi:lipopolysaccharide transport protein LptA